MRLITTTLLAASAALSLHAFAEDIKLQDNVPDRYTVVKGDTLWDISGRFLKEPWRWPDIWKMNRAQIKNPNLIYPGDVIVLDRSGKTPVLRLLRDAKISSGGLPVVKLGPRVRTEASDREAVPAISPSAIGPFLTKPLVVEENQLDGAPTIVASDDERVVMGTGDTAYVEGLEKAQGPFWQIYRPGKALVDPETKKVLGYEARYLGDAKVVSFGSPATITITKSVEEIGPGDKLIPAPRETNFSDYVPHSPNTPIKGQIISAEGAVAGVGQYAVIGINRGNKEGVERGDVLAIFHRGQVVQYKGPDGKAVSKTAYPYFDKATENPGQKPSFDHFYDPGKTLQTDKTSAPGTNSWVYADVGCLKPGAKVSYDRPFDPKEVYELNCKNGGKDEIKLPDERAGLAMVFRVFDHVSYAVVLNATRTIYILDVVGNP